MSWLTPTFLRPIDRLYFGPPRGQAAGEIHGGRSEFPPSPHTVAGIVRTHLLRDAERRGVLDHGLGEDSADAKAQRARLVGTRDELPAGWQLGPTLPAAPVNRRRRELMPWLPMPRCLAWPEAGPPVWMRRVTGTEQITADDSATRRGWFAPPPVPLREPAPRWLSAADLREIFSGKVPPRLGQGVRELPPFVHRERWAGVAVEDATRRAHDGLLYSLDMLRFEHGSGLLTWVQGPGGSLDPAALTRGVARAGNKGHLVQLESGHLDDAWSKLCAAPDTRQFGSDDADASTLALVYLATPTELADYRDPAPALRRAPPTTLTVEALAAFVDDPLVIGGLDTVSMTPQDNKQHVAAGSCWFVSVSGGSAAERAGWLASLHATHALSAPRSAAFGYGLTFIAPLPKAVMEGESHVRP